MKGCNCSNCGKRLSVTLKLSGRVSIECPRCRDPLLVKRDKDGTSVKAYEPADASARPIMKGCNCSNCGRRQGFVLKLSGKALAKCPKCGKPIIAIRDHDGITVKALDSTKADVAERFTA